MAQSVLLNGVVFSIPDVGDDNYGQDLTDYFVAIPSGVFQKTGGAFTLTADANFGATFGLVSAYFKSRTSTIATAGQLRLARADVISWRNQANDGNLDISVDSSNRLLYNGSFIALLPGALAGSQAVATDSSGGLVASTTTAAQLAYLNIAAGTTGTGSLVYSASPTMTGTLIVPNATISALTASRAVVTGSGGALAVSATTSTEIGYVSGVTSAIQTQLNAKQASGNYITALTGDGTASGPGSAALTLATVNSNVGSFGSSTSIPSFTVNGKGLITAASGNVVIAPAGTLTGTTLAANVVTSSLTSVGTITSGTWTGTTIAVANGGTGLTSGTSGGILYYSASGTLASSGALTANRLVIGGGAGTTPSVAAAITASRALVSDSNGVPTHSTTTTTQLQYLNAATGTTGTASTNVVFSAAPTLTGTVTINTSGALSISGTGNQLIVDTPGDSTSSIRIDNNSSEAGNRNFRFANRFSAVGQMDLGISTAKAGSTFTVLATATAAGGWQFQGTTTNDSAAAGYVGQYISAGSVGVTPGASGAFVNIASISLTAGDWDVEATAVLAFSSTTATAWNVSISTSSAAQDSVNAGGYAKLMVPAAFNVNDDFGIPVSRRRISVSATTTVYLVGALTYTVLGSASWTSQSFINARRVR